MNAIKLNYEMYCFDENNIRQMLNQLNLNSNNYFIAMTKPSLLKIALVGEIIEIANRYCIICFNETELNLIFLSRTNSKNATDLVKIPRNEISDIKLSNVLVSYMLDIKCCESKIKFQVFKKVAGFSNLKNSIDLFKVMYNLK